MADGNSPFSSCILAILFTLTYLQIFFFFYLPSGHFTRVQIRDRDAMVYCNINARCVSGN